MNPLVIGSIVLSSLSWSLFDSSRKKLAANVPPAPAVAWLMILQAPVFLAFGFLESWVIPANGYWLPAVASIVVNGLATLWFIEAVALIPFSLAIPILSLTPVFTTTGAFFALDERIDLKQIAGIAIIVAGTFILSRVESAKQTTTDAKSIRKGLVLMALVALMWALTPVFDKLCLRVVPSSEHGFLQCLGIAVMFAAYLLLKRIPAPTRLVKANLKWFAIAVFFASLALFTQLWTIQWVPVGIFEALKRSIGLIAALIIGHFLFGERISRMKVGLVGLIGIGIFVLLI
ncbi:MAG TPA: DMT family transporter [Bdellovibrionales bacterium]|nr:DMT family transporter [Bdellovibrionales bacterium]